METNRQRSRGLLKGKLMPFYRTPKPSPTVQYAAAAKPSPTVQYTATKPSPTSLFVVQDCVISQPKPKDYIKPNLMTLEEIYSVAVDESVDTKAAKYISLVQERLKLERVNPERVKYQNDQVN
ncbi:hypothetical protein L6164_004948 [Bauhinia variegata]|uniref:Uncharacterized protein n=1 Tax=Bauhinia variegata TaxID=167791 RepID=A0ACB9PPM5_BAUVA|nr:hypothetical protein L6164_004948 [Bauhinia variegata]